MKIKQNFLFSLIVALLFCLPPFFEGGNNPYILSFVFFLISVLIILTFFRGNPKKSVFVIWWKNPIFYIGAFLVVVFISNFFSHNVYFSWFYLLQYLGFFTLFLIILKHSFSQNSIQFLFFSFLAVSFILCLIGIYFYLNSPSNRIGSTFYQPNVFGGYLLFALPLAFFFLFQSEENREKALFGLVVIILFSTFILTNSRGAYLSFVFPFILLLFSTLSFFNKKDLLKKLIFVFVGTFIVVNLLYSLNIGEFSFFGITKRGKVPGLPEVGVDLSVFARFKFWQGAFEIFKDYPFLGSGLGSFVDLYPRYQYSSIAFTKYPHSHYLEILSETGFLGAIFFWGFIFFIVFLGFQKFRCFIIKKNKTLLIISILFCSILGSVLHNMVDFDWHFLASFLVFFIFLGLFLNLAQSNVLENKKEDKNLKNTASQSDKRLLPQYFFNSVSLFFQNNRKYLYFIIAILFIIFSLFWCIGVFYFNQGEKLELNQEYESAILSFQKGLKINPNPDYFLKEGILLYVLGDFDSAEKVAFNLTRYRKSNADVWRLLAKINEVKNERDSAKNFYQKAIECDPYFIMAHIDFADFYLKSSDYQKAIEILDAAVDKYQDDEIQYFKGRRKMYSRALGVEEVYFQNTEVDKIALLYRKKGEILEALGNRTEGQKYLRKSREILLPLEK